MGNWKKKLLYFGITLAATLLIGTIILVVYMQQVRPKEETMAETSTDIIETDVAENTDALASDNTSESGELPKAGASQAAHGSEDEKVAAQTLDDENEEKAQPEIEKGEAVLTFGGDICFYDEFANMYALTTRGGKMESSISKELLDEMAGSDVCMVNNEFPYSDRGTPVPEKAYAFRSKPGNVTLLAEMGVDIVSLANNHAFDYGEDAFLDSLDILNDADIAYAGAGKNLDEASQAVYFTVDNIKIGYLAATQIERMESPDTRGATENLAGVLRCFNEKELNHLLETIEQTKKQCDFLVVYMHWGTENTDELDWAQPYQADLISKAGADLIVGSHPHCLQGVDIVNSVPVVYSLGNYWFNSKALDTALLKVRINGDGLESIQMLPARQENCTTSLLTDSEKTRVINYLQGLSENVTIDADGMITW